MPDTPSARRSVTVVYNPVKVDDLDAAKDLVAKAAAEHGWEDPAWVATTEDETGEKQGREAVRAGADVVASLGGDGTVRAVASALVGTDVALGLLPGGTGNLLARNLGLPIDSLDDAVAAMFGGADRRIDVGLVRVADQPIQPRESHGTHDGGSQVDDDEEVFLVMAGLGLDGQVMAGTNEKVKAVIGWVAYVFSGLRQVFSRGFRVDVSSTGSSGVTGQHGDHEREHDEASGAVSRHARTVVIGNCGTLQGGLELMPEAKLDDGVLDAVVVAPKGAIGWISVISDLVTRHRAGHRRLDRLRGREFTVTAGRPVEAEIDGDPIGEHVSLGIRVLPDSLVVRVA
ncbi:diacylglycerol kinase family protein [Terrabacter aerolatus]|uniref:Sphingosine kinase n=1 Tax=Terrabacter aerolatus TaxID=422442 RepID=A0A512CZB1_9MICO|nr:diacylglycerol kinase family protein [Terrabacter aerolatus]GEO29527.1 sphingosine kinase [Terrabacter aerolatus]